jgi:subtilase family serine protease
VAPYDFGAIYNVTPLWNASTPINGSGQTIAIAGTSKLEGSATSPTDVIAFRTDFGVVPNTPSFNTIVGNSYDPGICTDPGTETNPPPCTIGDLTENSLDVEWSGAVAPGADLVLVASGYNSKTDPTNDPVYDSALYIVNNKVGNILNVSYGNCEWYEGTAGNVSYYNLWHMAASEGISVFVSSGDSGSASCDDGGDSNGTPYAAEYGLTVSGLASTPYNTAVGGTDFNWCPASAITSGTSCTASPYWGKSNGTNMANALGYVPEIPWNDTCVSPTGIAVAQYWASQLNENGF